jgi:serine/threonine protein kinase
VTLRRRSLNQLQRPVALKLLHQRFMGDESAIERFLLEARATAALSHPNIVVVLDHGIDEGVPWIAYEFLPGRSLKDLIQTGPLPFREALVAIRQVAAALEAAHVHGILHRDIKPANVMVAGPGLCKVADFGLAKWIDGGQALTRTGCIVGTPAYMAPEVLEGGTPTVASDVYAAGATLLHLLTGRVPGRPDSSGSRPAGVESRVGYPRALPASVERVVAKAAALDPAVRYPTACALKEAIDATLAGGSGRVTRGRDQLVRPLTPALPRVGAAAICLSVTLMTTFLGLLAWNSRDLPAVGPARASLSPSGVFESARPTWPTSAPREVELAIGSVRDRWKTGRTLTDLFNPFSDRFDLKTAARLTGDLIPSEQADLMVLVRWTESFPRLPLGEAPWEFLRMATRSWANRFFSWSALDRCRKHQNLAIDGATTLSNVFASGELADRMHALTYGSEGVELLRRYLETAAACYVRVGREPEVATSDLADLVVDGRNLAVSRGHLGWTEGDARRIRDHIAVFRGKLGALPTPAGARLGRLAVRFWDMGDAASGSRPSRTLIDRTIVDLEALRTVLPGAAAGWDRAIADLKENWGKLRNGRR